MAAGRPGARRRVNRRLRASRRLRGPDPAFGGVGCRLCRVRFSSVWDPACACVGAACVVCGSAVDRQGEETEALRDVGLVIAPMGHQLAVPAW